MFLISFVIDLIMAVVFVVRVRFIAEHGKVLIAVFKLLGDLAAMIAYAGLGDFALVIGLIVLLLNLLYLSICLEETSHRKKRWRKKKHSQIR